MINAGDLRKVQLTETENGYSIEEVNSVLNEAAITIEAYENENRELYHKLEVLAAKIEEYRAEEDSIKTALITAQKMADRIKKESTEEAEKLIADSNTKAETTVNEANEQADKIINEARNYSADLIKNKTDEADAIVGDAEKKANEAINSSKIVAQNILDQAKEISEDLVSKSREENEAYKLLNASLKKNAASFIENLKALYEGQLSALNSAKLDTSNYEEEQNISSIHDEVNSLVSEISEMEQAIPEKVSIEKPEYTPVPEDDADFKLVSTEPEDVEPENIDGVDSDIDVLDDGFEPEGAEDEPIEEPSSVIDEPADPMEAVEAFTRDEITPFDTSKRIIPEISEEPEMESSLFDEKLPFENYFNVKKDDAHLDKTQTISLIPPDDDDDDEPRFRGFFKKKK